MLMALDGLRVVDLSRLAPGPYCSMLLADFGADVLLVEATPGANAKLGDARARADSADRAAAFNALRRGKRSIALNLKDDGAREVFYRLVADADVVLEGFRPGVVARLGVDYEQVHRLNPRAVYCSLSGFGQTGPYANLVGHDINYIAIGGALGVNGYPGMAPAVPANIIADFAGGGLMAAFAVCVALLARERTGEGQYIDMAMSDGVFYLMASMYSGYFASGTVVRPGNSPLTGASPWYSTYECADGRWFSLGSLEPHFYEALVRLLGLDEFLGRQHDTACHGEMRTKIAAVMRTKSAEEWMEVMSQHDICAAPVRSLDEAVADPHNRARGMVEEVNSPIGPVLHPGIGPKLSATPGRIRGTAPKVGEHTNTILAALGYDEPAISGLRERGAVA